MSNFNVGLQLYTIRNEIKEIGLDEALARVRDTGYDYVEFAGYYDFTAQQLRDMLKKHGLKCVSIHQVPDKYLEENSSLLEFVKELGIKYSVIPWIKDKLLMDGEWENTSKKFADASRVLAENGIQLYYHNHNFEFEKENGKYIYDKIFDTLGTDVIRPQIDTCWMRFAGVDPCEYLAKYSGNVELLHLKDFVCDGVVKGPVFDLIDENGKDSGKKPTNSGFIQKPCGYGVVDFESILKVAEKAGTKYVIVENDECPEYPMLEAIKMSRDYLRSLGI